MKVLFISFWVLSMIIPAFQKDIEAKYPLLLKIYICIIPIVLSFLLSQIQ